MLPLQPELELAQEPLVAVLTALLPCSLPRRLALLQRALLHAVPVLLALIWG